jgi:hypothetical protein
MMLHEGVYVTRGRHIVDIHKVYPGLCAVGRYGQNVLAWHFDGKYCNSQRESEWDITSPHRK